MRTLRPESPGVGRLQDDMMADRAGECLARIAIHLLPFGDDLISRIQRHLGNSLGAHAEIDFHGQAQYDRDDLGGHLLGLVR